MKYLVVLACIALASASSIKAKDEKKSESNNEVTTQAPPQGWFNPWFYSGPEGKFVQKPFFQSALPPYPFWAAYPQAGAFYGQQFNPFFQYQAGFNPYFQYQGFAQQGQQGFDGQQGFEGQQQQPAPYPFFWKNFWASQPWAQQQEGSQEQGVQQQTVPFWFKPWVNPNPNVNFV